MAGQDPSDGVGPPVTALPVARVERVFQVHAQLGGVEEARGQFRPEEICMPGDFMVAMTNQSWKRPV